MNDEQADIPPEGLPDRRKHGYKELEQKLEDHVADIEKHQKKVFLGGLIMIAIIGITTAASIFAFGIILREQNRQANELLEQAEEIQVQRQQSLRTICENQNTNHDRAVKAIQDEGALREELAELVEAIVPKQDCDKFVNQLVKPTRLGSG